MSSQKLILLPLLSFIFILLMVFLYLLLIFSLRYLILTRHSLPLKNHRLLSCFLLEYLVCIIQVIITIFDYLFIPLRVFIRKKSPQINLSGREEKTPVILIPGYLMRAVTLWPLEQRLIKDGWKDIFYFDYFPPLKTIPEYAQDLACYLKRLIPSAFEGELKVDLICHSMGGLIARYYINYLGGEKRIRRFITLGTPHRGTLLARFSSFACGREMRPESEFLKGLKKDLPEEISVLALFSEADQMIIPASYSSLNQAQNVVNKKLDHLGHMSLLFSKKVYRLIANMLL